MMPDLLRTTVGSLLVAVSLWVLAVPAQEAPGQVTVWQTFPWLKEDETGDPAARAMMPPGQALAQLADAEFEPVCLSIVNRGGALLAYQLDVTALRQAFTPAGGGRATLEVKVLSSWVTPIRYADVNAAPLKTLGADDRYGNPRDVGDPLLDVTPDRVLYCPPGEARSVWLILHTMGAAPGVTRAPVRVVTATTPPRPVAEVNVTVQVWPFALPERLDIACYHWDYGCDERALRDMREHKVNAFMICDFPRDMKVAADGSVSGELDLERIRMKRQVVPWATFVGSYGGFQSFCTWAEKNKVAYQSPEFKELFAKGLQYMAAQYRATGLDYADYQIQTMDEANGEQTRRIIEMSPLARTAEPKMRWGLTVMTSMEEIKQMAAAHDCIMYRGEAYWSPDQQAWYQEWQKAGKTIWQFRQGGVARGTDSVHQSNRLRQWRTWLSRWDGSATFVYSACPYNPYGEPITVRQWEAVRESNEDYQYFALVRDLSRRLEATPAQAPRAAAARKLVDDLVQGLLGPTAPGTGMLYSPEDVVMMWYPYQTRARLAVELAALRQLLGEQAPAPAADVAYAPPWFQTARAGAAGNEPSLLAIPAAITGTNLPAGWALGDSALAQPLLLGRTMAGGLAGLVVPGAWQQDEFVASADRALEPGQSYRVTFEYQWPAALAGGSVIVEGLGTWRAGEAGGEGWHAFAQSFTVPAGAQPVPLRLKLKEFRLHEGEQVKAEAKWRQLRVLREDEGQELPGPAAPRLAWMPAQPGEVPASATLSLVSPNSYQPVSWVSSAVLLKGGSRYRLACWYRTQGTIQRALTLAATDATPGPKSQLLLQVSLPDTAQAWRWFTQDVMVPQDGEFALKLLAACQQAPDAGGLPRPALMEIGGLELRWLDTAPLLRLAASVEQHGRQLAAQSKAIKSPQDPLRQALAAVIPQATALVAAARAARLDGNPSPGALLAQLQQVATQLNARPYATWFASVQEFPLPALPPSSEVAYGTSALSSAQPKGAALLGGDEPPPKNPEDAAPIGLANFTDRPLCFMVQAAPELDWGFCVDRGAAGTPPKRVKPEAFLAKYGWCEFVVPAGETRYLWVGKSGRVELSSMDRRVPGVVFDVKIEAGLGLE